MNIFAELVILSLGIILSSVVIYKTAGGVRSIQFPFIYSVVHLLYIFPHIFVLVISSDPISNYYKSQGVAFTMATMSVLCYLAGLAGYILAKPQKCFLGYVPDRRGTYLLTLYSMILGACSLLAVLALSVRSGGLVGYFAFAGYYSQSLYGVTVWLLFVARFIYPAIAAMVIVYFAKPSFNKLVALTVLCVYPVLNIVFLFRRSDIFFLTFILAYGAVTIKGMTFRRVTIVTTVVGLAFIVMLAPALRKEVINEGRYFHSTYQSTDAIGYVMGSFDIKPGSETIASAVRTQKVMVTKELGWGTFIWNSLINQFLPSSLFGVDVKRSLLLRADAEGIYSSGRYDHLSFSNLAPMGYTQAFEQFYFGGWVIFFVIGMVAARMSKHTDSLRNQVFYMVALPYFALAATNDISSMPARILTLWVITRVLSARKGNVRIHVP